jgi:hypothetical protein
MATDVAGFIACDCAADRVPLPGGLVHDTDRRRTRGTIRRRRWLGCRALGATDADVGQGDVPWTVLADPEGNEFCVLGRG